MPGFLWRGERFLKGRQLEHLLSNLSFKPIKTIPSDCLTTVRLEYFRGNFNFYYLLIFPFFILFKKLKERQMPGLHFTSWHP
jgi:hypothetical protein